MVRGTTPTLIFTLPASVGTSEISNLYISFAQRGNIILEKKESDCTFNDDQILCTLTQADTLRFNESFDCEIQLRIKTLNGNALASNTIETTVNKILKDGEI